jgi:hypothetical protein
MRQQVGVGFSTRISGGWVVEDRFIHKCVF